MIGVALSTLLLIFVYQIGFADVIRVFCPKPEAIQFKWQSKDTWQEYGYTAMTSVNLPALGNQLQLTGYGPANKAYNLQAATWTDQTFLCLYNGNDNNTIIMWNSDLANYVSRNNDSTTPFAKGGRKPPSFGRIFKALVNHQFRARDKSLFALYLSYFSMRLSACQS